MVCRHRIYLNILHNFTLYRLIVFHFVWAGHRVHPGPAAPSAPRLHASLPKPPPIRLWCRGDANHGPRIFDDVFMMILKIRICASQKKGGTDMLEGDVSVLFISSGTR